MTKVVKTEFFTSQSDKTPLEILPKRSYKPIKTPLLDLSNQKAINLQRKRRIKISSWKSFYSLQNYDQALKMVREASCFTNKCQKICIDSALFSLFKNPLPSYYLFAQQAFEKIHYLKDIQLRNCGIKMTDQRLCQLCQSLKRSHYLKDLSMHFTNLNHITFEGFQQIFKGIKRLGSLQSLRLSFPKSDHMTDRRVHDISKLLKRLLFLQSVYIDLTDCQGITDTGIELLLKETEKLPNVQKFEINIETCGKVHPSAVRKMKKHKALKVIYEKVFEDALKKKNSGGDL